MMMKMKKMMKKTNKMMKKKMKNMMKMVMMQTAEMGKVQQQVVQDAATRCRCGCTFHILWLTSRLHTLQINLGLGGDGIANVSTMTLLKI